MAAAAAWLLALAACSCVIFAGAKDCEPGCTERGNCNEEEGVCECPWGYTGPKCEVDRMAACRQTPEDPGSCGYLFPKNCECFRACYKLYCWRYGTDTERCVSEMGAYLREAPCFLHKPDRGHAVQDSWFPENHTETAVWYSQIPELFDNYNGNNYEDRMLLKDLSLAEKPPYHRAHLPWRIMHHKAHPLHHCENNCSSGRGVCLQYHHRDKVECACHMGYNGTYCQSVDAEEACWFSPNCGGRGSCKSGFCHCQPGYWGMGCARSRVGTAAARARVKVAPLGGGGGAGDGGGGGSGGGGGGGLLGAPFAATSLTRLKIYKYELPWTLAFPWEMIEWAHTRDQIYASFEYFLKYFLQDTAVQTEDPEEANLFYVPALVYHYIANVRNPAWQFEAVLDHIRARYPYYNRSGGADHFVWFTGDRGACHVPRHMQDSMIKVVNFGMQRKNITWPHFHNRDYGCIQMKRDVVVPPNNPFAEVLPKDTTAYYQWLVANGGRDANRTRLFSFAGGVGDGTEYSGGVRQAIRALLNATNPRPADVDFFEGRIPDYRTLLRNAKFCIAPYGHGWGIRLIQSIQHGCIPIILQDGVYQAFEDFLPYEEFSVRMPLADVPHMIELLRQYDEDALARLRLGMAKYYRAFIWDREYGGQAYEWTLSALQRRLHHARASYYHTGGGTTAPV